MFIDCIFDYSMGVRDSLKYLHTSSIIVLAKFFIFMLKLFSGFSFTETQNGFEISAILQFYIQ